MALCDFQGRMRKGRSAPAAVSWATGSGPGVAVPGGGPQATSWRNRSWRAMPEEPGCATVPSVDARGPQPLSDHRRGLSESPSQGQRPSASCYPFTNK